MVPGVQTPEVDADEAVGAVERPAGGRGARRAAAVERLGAGFICAGSLGVLVVASILDAAPEGHGTHEQLGLTPCAWPLMFGAPCPTCGMTTAFAHAADGDGLGALWTQPFGAGLALMAAAAFWGAGHVAVTGSRVGRVALAAVTPRLIGIAALLAGAAWVFKLMTWEG